MSVLDHAAISGAYLFPQRRRISSPFTVPVDGCSLACYSRILHPDHFTVIHFHGNGEAVADYVPEIGDQFAELGLNSLFVEYRQYGDSTGDAQLTAMLGDGQAAMHAAGIQPEKTIAFGRSIGSLYAIELAAREPALAGLIIESGIADPAERFLVYADIESAGIDEAEVKAEVKRCFNHKEKLATYKNPVLLLHAENDGLVDVSHAERNLKWAGSNNKRLVRFSNGTHNTIFRANYFAYIEAIRSFLKSL